MDEGTSQDPAPFLPRLAGIQMVLEASPEAWIVVDALETIVVVNQGASELLGYAPQALRGRNFDVLVPPGREGQVVALQRAWADSPTSGALGRGMDLRALRADGTEVPIELTVTSVTTESGPVALVALRDVTVMHHDTRLFRALLEAAPDPVVIVNEAGAIRLVNQAAAVCFGYEHDDLLGQSVEVLVPERYVRAHEHLRLQTFSESRPRSMGHVGTLHARRKDGSEFPVDISLAPVATEEGQLVIAEIHDLTDRLAAIESMNKAQEQQRVMAEIERVKDQFLATVSHELRTPLSSIIGFCELITEIEGLDPDARHFMSIISRNARREARLVDDLLTLVNIDHGGLSVRPASVDLTTLVSDAVNSAQPEATAAGIGLSLEDSTDPIPILCDPERIGQALDGLLTNALKFTPAGGRVHVAIELGAATASITVVDTGMGIDDPEPNRVFDRLYRSPLAIEREIPGAGIGLSIATAIATAHHGSLRLIDTGPQGTTFAIELPLTGRPNSTMPTS
jgi:protein-histidine pros-kinase